MPNWTHRAAFLSAMLVPILVGLWIFTAVLRPGYTSGALLPPPSPPASPTAVQGIANVEPTVPATPESTPMSAAAAQRQAEPTTELISTAQPSMTIVMSTPATEPPAARAQPTALASATANSATSRGSAAQSTVSADPMATVRDFYSRVEQHQFAAAAELWSPRMRASFPPGSNIDQRFADTQSIRIEQMELRSLDVNAGRAIVGVQIVEAYGRPTAVRRFGGTWSLIRGSNDVWLLDQPSLVQQ